MVFQSLFGMKWLKALQRRPLNPQPVRSAPRWEELEKREVPAAVGIYALGKAMTPLGPRVFTNPNVDGIAVRANWDAVEPTPGAIDWSYLDSQIAAASAAVPQKKVSLSLMAGIHTPTWAYPAAARFTFVDDQTSAPQTIPIPWDPTYLANLEHFITAFGQKYAANALVTQARNCNIGRRSCPPAAGAAWWAASWPSRMPGGT